MHGDWQTFKASRHNRKGILNHDVHKGINDIFPFMYVTNLFVYEFQEQDISIGNVCHSLSNSKSGSTVDGRLF